jgi:hypothetical protein
MFIREFSNAHNLLQARTSLFLTILNADFKAQVSAYFANTGKTKPGTRGRSPRSSRRLTIRPSAASHRHQ